MNALFKPYKRERINSLLWASAVFIVVGVRGIVDNAVDGNPIRVVLTSLLTAYFVLTLARVLWDRRQYAGADELNRAHGR